MIYPDLDRNSVLAVAEKFNSELDIYFREIINYLCQEGIQSELANSWRTNPNLWYTCLRLCQYGVIYFMSRHSARCALTDVAGKEELFLKIASFLAQQALSVRIMNYAVHRFITNTQNRCVKFSDELIPKNAFYAVSGNILYVREQDFQHSSLDVFKKYDTALYDLHDFSHLAAATINPVLYGSKYFDSLVKLENPLKNLIKSPFKNTARAVPFSDGLIFSHCLTHLFTQAKYNTLSDTACVATMAKKVFNYYLAQDTLYHPSINNYIAAKRPMQLYELMTLSQNKSYELIGSELERNIFVRGGNNQNDELKNKNPLERLILINQLPTWFYFERRNTLKHRAQTEAYRLVARHILHNLKNELVKKFAKKTLDNLNYNDYREGNRENLWCLIYQQNQIEEARCNA